MSRKALGSKKICALIKFMKIKDVLLKVRLSVNNRYIWVIVCPTEFRTSAIRQHHGKHHSGVNNTYTKVRLNWY